MPLQKMNNTMIAMAKLARDNGLTGDEYILILQTMVAQVLSENDKRLEHKFRENLRKDTLTRRLNRLKTKPPEAVEVKTDSTKTEGEKT